MAEPSVSSQDVARWAEAVAGLARTGLAFSDNQYERERYEELLHVAGDMAASISPDRAAQEIVAQWSSGIATGASGYVTPKVGVGAFVGDDQGRLLMIKRTDNHRWFFPTGWCDVGYSPAEVVVKEVSEECGLDVEPVQVVSVIDGLRAGSPIPHYNVIFLCRLLGGELNPHPLECEDIGWFAENELPEPMVGQGLWRHQAFAALRGEVSETYFDPPRSAVWRTMPGA